MTTYDEWAGQAGSTPEMIAAAEAVIQRIEAIDWDAEPAPGRVDSFYASAALLREYLRRMALWSKALEDDPDESAPDSWDFNDLGYHLAPDVRAEQAVIDRFEEFLERVPLGSFTTSILEAVHWRALAASGDPRYQRYASLDGLDLDPYEPLLRYFEHGRTGFGFLGNGEIEFGTLGGLRRGTRDENLLTPPLLDLSDEHLDEIERQGSERRRAYFAEKELHEGAGPGFESGA